MRWRVVDERKWHPWFAWRPVRLPDNRRAWLEVVSRKEFVWRGNGDAISWWEYESPDRAPVDP